MRIRDYKKATGLTLDEVKRYFGSPSPYRDSRTATLVTEGSTQGTLVIFEEGDDLVLCSIRAMTAGGGWLVMRKVCELADRHKVVVDDLPPSPFPLSKHSSGVRKLHKKTLITFYQRFGFVMGSDKNDVSTTPLTIGNVNYGTRFKRITGSLCEKFD